MGLDDGRCDTVYQQMTVRNRYLVKMLGLAAKQAGASSTEVSRVESRMSTREISAETVYQQIATRQTAVVKMAGILAVAQ